MTRGPGLADGFGPQRPHYTRNRTCRVGGRVWPSVAALYPQLHVHSTHVVSPQASFWHLHRPQHQQTERLVGRIGIRLSAPSWPTCVRVQALGCSAMAEVPRGPSRGVHARSLFGLPRAQPPARRLWPHSAAADASFRLERLETLGLALPSAPPSSWIS